MIALRLYTPDLPTAHTRTLRDVYEEMLPLYPDSMSPRTKSEHRTSLAHWERITGNPSLAEVDRELITKFRDGLIGAGVVGETINKVWRTLRAMFRFSVDELKWIDTIPSISPFMRSRLVDASTLIPREVLSHEEIERMWGNCLIAKYPTVEPCRAWRTFIVLAWVTGMRTGDLVKLPWSAVLWNQKLIRFAADKTSKLQGLPLLPFVEWHLSRWREVAPPGDLIFSGFKSKGHYNHRTLRVKRGYYTEWKYTVTAGVSEKPFIKNLRADMVTELNDLAPGVGGWAAGHSPKGVTDMNYDKPTKRVRKTFAARQIPPCFLWGMHDGSEETVQTGADGANPPAAFARAE